jgi:molybdopterin synthase catalytic subunit
VSELTERPIDSASLLLAVGHPGAGALLTFTGVVRDNHRGKRVTAIEYEAYPEMALKEMDAIEGAVERKWPEVTVRIVHRTGRLAVGDASVVIAVSSPHRAEGFAALREAIESLKARVPIWKKEIYPDGHAWIEGS